MGWWLSIIAVVVQGYSGCRKLRWLSIITPFVDHNPASLFVDHHPGYKKSPNMAAHQDTPIDLPRPAASQTKDLANYLHFQLIYSM